MNVRSDSPFRRNHRRAELGLRLRLEHRLDDAHADRRLDPRPDVRWVILLLVESANHLHQRLPECRKVRPALRGVLPVYERIVVLAALLAVGERDLDVLPHQMDRRIQRLALHLLAQQIQQAVLRPEFLAVENDRQAGIQVGIIPAHLLHDRIAEFRLRFGKISRSMSNASRVPFSPSSLRGFFMSTVSSPLENSSALVCPSRHAWISKKSDKCVHRLDADPVQPHRFFERLAVILRTGVDLRRAVEKFPQRNPPPEIPHLHPALVVDLDPDLLPVPHDVLVDGVVHRLLEQDVDAVVRR